MDRHKAKILLEADETGWYLNGGIICRKYDGDAFLDCSHVLPSVAETLAAGPDLARWGIERDEECERLRAELAEAEKRGFIRAHQAFSQLIDVCEENEWDWDEMRDLHKQQHPDHESPETSIECDPRASLENLMKFAMKEDE